MRSFVRGQYVYKWTDDIWQPFDLSELNFELSPPASEVRNKPWVLLVHGFTGDLDSMSVIARRLVRAKYLCLGYQYPSDERITLNGGRLRELLLQQKWEVPILPERPPIAIVAHSMGGLVSRAVFLNATVLQAARIKELVRGIVSLGTPHDGTLARALHTMRLLKTILRCGEVVSKTPVVRSVSRSSNWATAQELAKADKERVIDKLNGGTTATLPIVSISGGWEYRYEDGNILAVIGQGLENLILKSQLQSPHDGLVPEVSSDITRVLQGRAESLRHFGESGYANWGEINHTELVTDEVVFGTLRNALSSL